MSCAEASADVRAGCRLGAEDEPGGKAVEGGRGSVNVHFGRRSIRIE